MVYTKGDHRWGLAPGCVWSKSEVDPNCTMSQREGICGPPSILISSLFLVHCVDVQVKDLCPESDLFVIKPIRDMNPGLNEETL